MDLLSDLNPAVRRSLLKGPLSPYVELYVEHLVRCRYAACTARRHLAAVAHFARWMDQIGLSPEGLEDRHLAEFLSVHLPQCECPRSLGRRLLDLRPGIRHLLALLREQGITQVAGPPTSPIADELSAYDSYMLDARSLAPGTRQDHLRIIGRLLRFKFAGRAIAIHRLGVDDVRRFVAGQLAGRKGTSTALQVAAALRQYFRYRVTHGDVVDRLMAAVPSPAQWSLARLPCALSADETDQLLAAFPCSSLRAPRRAYAIVRMALDPGLRASEIMRLELDDIDWRAGTLTLREGKACRVDVLPLPEVTGQAVVDYLRHERPQTSNRAVPILWCPTAKVTP